VLQLGCDCVWCFMFLNMKCTINFKTFDVVESEMQQLILNIYLANQIYMELSGSNSTFKATFNDHTTSHNQSFVERNKSINLTIWWQTFNSLNV